MLSTTRLCLAPFLALTLACQSLPTVPRVTGGTRVLFVGNSHTYVNDVPGLVVAIGRQLGDDSLSVATIAFPDFAIEDHWNEGTSRRALAQQDWEFVVFQQGPSSLPSSRVHLEEWTRRFDPVVRQAGGVPVMYQVWPTVQRRGDAANSLQSYLNAARAVGGRIAPAGAAWDSVFSAHEDVVLYSGDGLHASPFGSWLAAVVIYSTLRGIDPNTLPAELPRPFPSGALPSEQVRRLLQRASLAMAGVTASSSEGRRAAGR